MLSKIKGKLRKLIADPTLLDCTLTISNRYYRLLIWGIKYYPEYWTAWHCWTNWQTDECRLTWVGPFWFETAPVACERMTDSV